MSFVILIPSKTWSNLSACVKAIRAAGENCKIVAVDDGIDWPFDEPQAWMGDFEAIMGDKPFIFSRNVNIGIEHCAPADCIILNDDAVLKTPDGFTGLAEECKTATAKLFGLIASSCNTVGNINQHHRSGPILGLREEPRMVCFVCVYIPRSTINAVGLLDEEFTGYGLDDDSYCLRVRRAGLKLGIFDGCFVDHSSLVSSYRGGAQQGGDFTGNMRIFIKKYGVDNWGRGRDTSEFAHLFPKEGK